MAYIYQILILLVLLFIAALTAASETSIIASSIIKLRRLSNDGSKTARIILKILETPERFFGTILVSNNIVGALIASIITAVMIPVIGDKNKGIIIATFVSAVLIIVFEVSAKTLAARNPIRLSLSLARLVRFLIIAFSPVVKILSIITNFIVNLLGGKSSGKPSLVVEDEIKALIRIGEDEGSVHKDKYKMLTKIFEFSEAVVKDVMIPRDKMFSIDRDSNIDVIVEKVIESGYSRVPVYRGKPDDIIGIINMKDLLNLSVNKELVILEDILYPPIFVQSSRKITDLLKEFQKGHTHLAVVTSAEGKLEGLVTLEDLLEEIVGEINDEFDIRSVT